MSERLPRRRPRSTVAARRVAIVMSILAVMATAATSGLALEPDPTRPPTDAARTVAQEVAGDADAASGFALEAVLFASGRRIAIVNGRRVVEGDRVGGARVEAITPRSVRLTLGPEMVELSLAPEPVKRPRDVGTSTVFPGPPPAAPFEAHEGSGMNETRDALESREAAQETAGTRESREAMDGTSDALDAPGASGEAPRSRQPETPIR